MAAAVWLLCSAWLLRRWSAVV